jgi:hypothetical protein
VVYRQPFHLDDFDLQVFKIVIAQIKLAFERPVRHAPLALE